MMEIYESCMANCAYNTAFPIKTMHPNPFIYILIVRISSQITFKKSLFVVSYSTGSCFIEDLRGNYRYDIFLLSLMNYHFLSPEINRLLNKLGK